MLIRNVSFLSHTLTHKFNKLECFLKNFRFDSRIWTEKQSDFKFVKQTARWLWNMDIHKNLCFYQNFLRDAANTKAF